MPMHYHRIIIPVSGGPEDDRAIDLVGELAQRHPTNITLVYVVEVPQAMPLDAELPDKVERGEAALEQAERLTKHRLPTSTDLISTDLLQARSAGAAIVDEAIEQNADVILMATAITIKYGKQVTGEAAAYVMRNAPCDVILVRVASDLQLQEA
ncbi:MAG: universal stress protein [Thermomicrobiales bacterium]|nr:universal stress protein [Thermomicrobiales bacterium]